MIKKIFRIFGFEITRSRSTRQTLFQAIQHLKELGFNPNVIIDAGVAQGTPAIYSNFPNTKTILIEPLPDFEKAILKILDKHSNYIYIPKALSESKGCMDIYKKDSLSGSSFFISKSENNFQKISVDCISLSDIVKGYKITSPALLKLDIEGGEKGVLESSIDVISLFDIVVCEVTFIPKLVGAPPFSDIIKIMSLCNYSVFDIVDLRYYKKSKRLFQADIVFVKAMSDLRKIE